MLSKSTVWQGWQEDLLHHIWSAALYQSTLNHEVIPWAVQCGYLSSWFPSVDSLLSLHIMIAYDTTSVLQPREKWNM